MKPVKLLVTHQNPDMDAMSACWLFLKFDDEVFHGAQLYFVPAGEEIDEATLRAKTLNKDEVVHVDTGMGEFDHHQPDNAARDSATLRVYEYLVGKYPDLRHDEALKRMVVFINDTDHFAACYWPEADHDRYHFMLEEVLKGIRGGRQFNDREMVDFGAICLDGVYVSMRMKVSAEADLLALGKDFTSKWGKSLMIENSNDEVVKLAQKQGYRLVVRKDKEKGHIRIKAVPEKGVDLTGLYEKILKEDAVGTWYLHPSKAMLLNGSSRNDKHIASPLGLDAVVGIILSL